MMAVLGIGAGCLLVLASQACFGETAPCFGLKGCSSIVQAAIQGSSRGGVPLLALGIGAYTLASVLPFTRFFRWTPWFSFAASAFAVRITIGQAVAGESCPWTALPGILLLFFGIASLSVCRQKQASSALFAMGTAASLTLVASVLVRPSPPTARSSPIEAADRQIVTGLSDPALNISVLWGSPWNPETQAVLDEWHQEGRRTGKILVYRFLPMTGYRQERITAALLKACVKKGVLPKGAFAGSRQAVPALDALADDLGISSANLLLEESKVSADQGVAVHLQLKKKGSHLIDCLPYEPCRLRAEAK